LTNRVQSRHEEFFNDCCEAIEHSETREDKNDPPAVFDPTGHDIVRAAIGSNLRGQHRQYRKCRLQNCHPHAHAFALVKEREIAEDEKSEGTPRAIRTQARVFSSSLSRNGESEARTHFPLRNDNKEENGEILWCFQKDDGRTYELYRTHY